MPPIKYQSHAEETKAKPRHYNPSEFNQILKQTLSNIQGSKKVWVPPAAQQSQIATIKKISDHKKNYISPYSQKAILQQKPIG